MVDNSLVMLEREQNIVGKRTGGRAAPTTVNSSVRTREYLTTAEIERLMAAARKSSRYNAVCSQRHIPMRPKGWAIASLKMIEDYTRAADQARLARNAMVRTMATGS
jgi:hypothetical protein